MTLSTAEVWGFPVHRGLTFHSIHPIEFRLHQVYPAPTCWIYPAGQPPHPSLSGAFIRSRYRYRYPGDPPEGMIKIINRWIGDHGQPCCNGCMISPITIEYRLVKLYTMKEASLQSPCWKGTDREPLDSIGRSVDGVRPDGICSCAQVQLSISIRIRTPASTPWSSGICRCTASWPDTIRGVSGAITSHPS